MKKSNANGTGRARQRLAGSVHGHPARNVSHGTFSVTTGTIGHEACGDSSPSSSANGTVLLLPPPSWVVHDSDSLAAYMDTPQDATQGRWSAAQHVGVKRAIFLRSFRFAHRQLGAAGASPHLQALSQMANSGNVMRSVLCFAVPCCTPTPGEASLVAAACEQLDGAAVVARWLNRGVSPDFLHANCPLIWRAASKSRVATVSLLVISGVNVDQARTDNGRTPLYVAAGRGHDAVVEVLIAAGADVDEAETTTGSTPLLIAASRSHLAVVSQLVAAGADVSKATVSVGATPLYVAAQQGHVAVAKMLLETHSHIKCDVVNKARKDIGATPLYIAAEMGHGVMVEVLLARGADVDAARTDIDASPLFIAASKGHVGIVQTLLKHGADKSIRGWQNKTPLDAAQGNSHYVVVSLLLAEVEL